jgi:uroporphyrinogen decarboxylase
MVEGGSSDDYHRIKTLMYARPDLLHRILAVNAEAVAAYLNAQIDAGAQAVMVFDSWGGVLAGGAFQTFSLAYTARVLAGLKRHDAAGHTVPRIVFTKGGGLWLADMAALNCDVLGLDWTVNLGQARHAVTEIARQSGAPIKALQGNLDPAVLLAPPEAIRREARRVLDDFGAPHHDLAGQDTPGSTHIFNLGHGISQHTPPEHVAALAEEVQRYSQTLRQCS